jgi:hypothetical protein
VGGVEVEELTYFLPVHLLQAMLDRAVEPLEMTTSTSIVEIPASLAIFQPLKSRLPLYKFPHPGKSWIASVGKYLVHTWIDSQQYTTKGAKRDDATIAINMWNQRLVLLYPQCTEWVLEVFRSWLLRYGRRRLLHGLRKYLAQHYGSQWVTSLILCRELRGRYSSTAESRDKINTLFCQQGGLSLGHV